MEEIEKEVNRSKEAFVMHYRSKYREEQYLPVWMVTECISFGALSTMYKGLPRDLQRDIADHFDLAEGALKSWLHTLSYIRNSCAHHNRIWNKKLSIRPSLPPRWAYLTPAPERIYAVLLIIQHLLSNIAPRCRWKDRLMTLILSHPDVSIAAMGFPANWKELSPWKVSEV
jgi:abortive infection bacteriophage resistance protein